MADHIPAYEGWAIVELMGHRRLAGEVSEVIVAGSPMLRLDIPSDPPATQFYSAAAIYCLTPTSEETAREVARLGGPKPVETWELKPKALDAHYAEED